MVMFRSLVSDLPEVSLAERWGGVLLGVGEDGQRASLSPWLVYVRILQSVLLIYKPWCDVQKKKIFPYALSVVFLLSCVCGGFKTPGHAGEGGRKEGEGKGRQARQARQAAPDAD